MLSRAGTLPEKVTKLQTGFFGVFVRKNRQNKRLQKRLRNFSERLQKGEGSSPRRHGDHGESTKHQRITKLQDSISEEIDGQRGDGSLPHLWFGEFIESH